MNEQIKDRKIKRIPIEWESNEKSENIEEMLNKADKYSEEAKEVRALSIKIDKERDLMKNMLITNKLALLCPKFGAINVSTNTECFECNFKLKKN